MRKSFVLICAFWLSAIALMAQNKVVKGTVSDNETGDPLIGVTIQEVGTSNGIITDIDGNFTLSVRKTPTTIKVSYLGYVPQTISVSSTAPLAIRMKSSTHELSEMVVIGYSGSIIRSKLTNSISTVKPEALTTGMFSNPAAGLSGTVSGLRVIQSTGNPNSSPSIILRGGTDYNGSGSPLVVVDGMIRSMFDINPNDIESMEVLKDAGSTAIYGSRANNGVILVTTKKGKKGEGKLTFSGKVSFNYFNNPYEFASARDYLYYERLSYKYANEKGTSSLSALSQAQPFGTGNDYYADGNASARGIWGVYDSANLSAELRERLLREGWQTMTDPIDPNRTLFFTENRMEDWNIKSPAISQDYSLSYSGGTDRGRYYASLGYNKSEGNAINNYNRRLSFLLNADHKIKPWLTSISNFNFSTTKYAGISPFANEANYFSRNFSYPPTFRAYNNNGELLLGKNTTDGNQKFLENALDRDLGYQKFAFSQDFKFNIIRGLTVDFKGDWFYEYRTNQNFYHTYLASPGRYNSTHTSNASVSNYLTQNYNILINYRKEIGKHSLSALLGWEYFHTKDFALSASGQNPLNNYFRDLQYTVRDEGMRTIDTSHAKFATESYFTRLNYDYDGKYLASFTLRQDGISKLSKDNRWGTFPGASLGWVFTKEEFAKKYDSWLSFGKLRSSFGLNGNVNSSWVGNYTVQGSFSNSTYRGGQAFYLNNIPNPYLTWETSRTFELGLDLGFLHNKIQTNFTWYQRTTYDKYASITIPASSGYTSITSNNGTLRNSGIEFDVNYHILNTKDLRVDFNFNIAHNMNKVIKLPANGNDKNRQGGYQVYTGNGNEMKWVGGYAEGERPGDLYVFQAEGIYRSEGEIPGNLIDRTTSNNLGTNRTLYGPAAYASTGRASGGLPIKPGDVKWKDVNGDGVIDNYDLVKVGNTTPKWIGGSTISASYKGLALAVRLDYALGFVSYDYRTPQLMGNMQGTYNMLTAVKDTWSPENPNGKLPIYIWADQSNARNYDRYSTLFCYKGDYLSFREVTLSYTLPQAWSRKAKMESVKVSITGQNLGYICEAPNVYSPEVSAANGGYPLPRMLVLGLNVTF